MRADGSERNNLSADARGQRGRRRVLAGRLAARVPQRAHRQRRPVRDGSRRRQRRAAHERRGARQLPGVRAERRRDRVLLESRRRGRSLRQPHVRQLHPRADDRTAAPAKLRRISDDPGQDSHPWYSPDGQWIVYTSERGGLSDEEPMVQEVVFGPQMYGEIYAYRLSDGLDRAAHPQQVGRGQSVLAARRRARARPSAQSSTDGRNRGAGSGAARGFEARPQARAAALRRAACR